MTSLPSVHHDHSCSPFTQEVVCAALTARLDEWPEICVALASVLYPYFFRSRSLPVILRFYWLGERTSYCESAHRMAHFSSHWQIVRVSLRKRYVSERIGDIVELYVYVSWHCFTVSLVCDSPDPRNTSKSLSMWEMWCDHKQLLFQCRHCLINKLLRL